MSHETLVFKIENLRILVVFAEILNRHKRWMRDVNLYQSRPWKNKHIIIIIIKLNTVDHVPVFQVFCMTKFSAEQSTLCPVHFTSKGSGEG